MKYNEISRRCELFSGLLFAISGFCQFTAGSLALALESLTHHPIQSKGICIWSGIISSSGGIMLVVISCRKDEKRRKMVMAMTAAVIVGLTNVASTLLIHFMEWKKWFRRKSYDSLSTSAIHMEYVYQTSIVATFSSIVAAILLLIVMLMTYFWQRKRNSAKLGLERLTRLERYMHIYHDISMTNILTSAHNNSLNLDYSHFSMSHTPSSNSEQQIEPVKFQDGPIFGLPFSSILMRTTRLALAALARFKNEDSFNNNVSNEDEQNVDNSPQNSGNFDDSLIGESSFHFQIAITSTPRNSNSNV